VEVETRAPRAFATTGAHLTAAAACAIDIDIVCFAVPERHSRARATAIGDPGLFCSRDDDEVYLILNLFYWPRSRTRPSARVKPPEGCFPGAEKSPNSKMTQLSHGHSMW
jgi:hypothetical protein